MIWFKGPRPKNKPIKHKIKASISFSFSYHHKYHLKLSKTILPLLFLAVVLTFLLCSSSAMIWFYCTTGKLFNPPVPRAAKALVENVCIWRQKGKDIRKPDRSWVACYIHLQLTPAVQHETWSPWNLWNLGSSRPISSTKNKWEKPLSGVMETSSSVLMQAERRSSSSKLSQGSRFSESQ